MSLPVRLSHYDPSWRQEFEQTRSSILMSCSGWVQSVEHIGGTAIPGLIAQAIVDCVAGVVAPEGLEAASTAIEGLNYRREKLPTWVDDGILFTKPRHGPTTHRIFLTRIDSPLWSRVLRVRDWLREHPEVAYRFEDAKVKQWKAASGDPCRYAHAKAIFFAHLEDQIHTTG